MTSICRALRWPADRTQLEALDVSFDTVTIYDVTRPTPLRFALEQHPVSPPLSKRYTVDWSDIASGRTAPFVPERSGRAVGLAAVEFSRWNRRATLTHLYVDRRERRTGIGRARLAHARGVAAAQGASRLWVETQNVNAPAIAFYLRHSFEFAGLDVTLYDPRAVPGETAVFFALDLDEGH